MSDDQPVSNVTHPIEYQVFALSFREPGAIKYFKDNLDPEIVGINDNQHGVYEFYNALLSYASSTDLNIVDPILFKNWIQLESNVFDALNGDEGTNALMSVLSDMQLATPEAVVQVLKHKDNKIKQKNYLKELEIILSQKGLKSDEDLERINVLTGQIKDLENKINYDPLDGVVTANQIIDKIDSLLDTPDFLPTQFKSLNRAMGYTNDGGFFKGAVHAIIAASGKGKSTFAKCLVNNWLDSGYKALYINFEEARTHWERILMTQITGKNIYSELDKWTEEEKNKYIKIFTDKLETWGDRLMVKHDPDTPYFEDLESWLRDILVQGEHLPDVVVIDTIQSMFTRSKGKARWGEFEEMMVRLEKIARDMNCVLIITAQENSNRMKEKREIVMQSDTGGSLAIQQKCAVTIFITEKKLVSGDDSEDENIMQLQIPKNRITGSTFSYEPPLVRYVDSRKSYEEYEIVTSASYDASSILDDLLNNGDFN
jgi:replicative DNA helicase